MDLCYEVVCKLTKRSLFRRVEGFPLEIGDSVVIDVGGRKELGEVVWKGEEEASEAGVSTEGARMRTATPEDIKTFQSRHQKEIEALEVFTRNIALHGLPMKPVEVEFEDDCNRIMFYFTADHRIDFRALVKDLARIYRTRIELRQINLRQCVQRLGEYGTCGRPLCCVSFMHQVPAVPAQAAHVQALAQNPAKLTGVCGQLKCCLRYELEYYRQGGSQLDESAGCGGCCGAKDEVLAIANAEDEMADPISFSDDQVEQG
ncbi:MAG: regulatory iron-sulfur-containing complex subunit RicT [bacterium]|nr:regulatory iron-sulfur-containing complex subunit RicT [bacterium]